jgi:hypothetical protein
MGDGIFERTGSIPRNLVRRERYQDSNAAHHKPRETANHRSVKEIAI